VTQTNDRTARQAAELNGPLLELLKSAAGQWLAVRHVMRTLRLSSGALDDALDRMARVGFNVLREGNRVRLAGLPDVLSSVEIREQLGTSIVGRNVILFDTIGSTNDAAWEAAANGAPDGTAVVAERQTAGRGRMGRSWASPRGGLWMSVVLRPNLPVERLTVLTMAASVAAARAIRVYPGCNAVIHWPNDIYVAGRKAAGILVETRSERLLSGTFIVGIGINVGCCTLPEELAETATVLSKHTKVPLRRADMARLILQNLDRQYLRVLDGEYGQIGREWLAMSATVGRRITIVQNGRTYRGEVVDMDPVAGLMVRLDRGFVRAFRGEHVTVLK